MMGGFILAAALAAAAPDAAQPSQIRFTGHTTADATLIRDALNEVARFSGHALKCGELTAVEASILPDGWQPADPNYRIGPPGTRYERWAVAQCGRTVPFLLGFWNAAEGGTLFQVGYPFPEEPRPAANR